MNRIALILATLALACTAAPPEVGAATEDLGGDFVTGLVGPTLGNNGTVARLEDGATAVYLGQVWTVLDAGDEVDVQWKAAGPSTMPPIRAELAILAGLSPLSRRSVVRGPQPSLATRSPPAAASSCGSTG